METVTGISTKAVLSVYICLYVDSLLTQDIVVKLHKCFAEIKVKDEYDDGFGLIHGC